MAGDWIKMTHDLPEKPEVAGLSSILGMDRYAVVGRLHRLWGWFDRHTTDGCAADVTPAFLDSLVAHEGFAQAMISVGWLVQRNGRILVPNFDRHISKSAKDRGLASERMKRSRYGAGATKPSPEKRRVEKKVSPDGDTPPRSPPAEIPESLDRPDFRTAWKEWLEYRRSKRKPVSATAAKQQLANLAAYGADVATEAIRISIRSDWQGLFPEKVNANGNRRSEPGPGQRFHPGSELGAV